jgi:hypothetical protein
MSVAVAVALLPPMAWLWLKVQVYLLERFL